MEAKHNTWFRGKNTPKKGRELSELTTQEGGQRDFTDFAFKQNVLHKMSRNGRITMIHANVMVQ